MANVGTGALEQSSCSNLHGETGHIAGGENGCSISSRGAAATEHMSCSECEAETA